jgi:hypothetical protein
MSGMSEQEQTSFMKTRFLDDSPTKDDAFGPHRQIAEAILELVQDEDTDGGKTIGLTGTWGSGKSSVLEIIYEKLQKVPAPKVPTKLFVFDSWAHQGDPLRRSFLEELDRFIESVGWGGCGNWKQSLKELRTETRVTKKNKFSALTRTGKWFISLMAIAFVTNSLVNHYAFDTTFPFQDVGLQAGEFWWLYSAAPVLLILVTLSPVLLLWFKRTHETSEKDENSPLLLFLQKTPETEITEVEQTANPTSLEFRECFLSMMEAVLDDSNRRLIIAFDNLDRVDPGDAREIIVPLGEWEKNPRL